ncbi:MAG: cysteine synthase A, partial [Pseudomonadota bacterium]
MHTCDGVLDSIGRTPLVKLRAASEATGCAIYGKAEYANPGGSVKDRAALGILRDAEARGVLKPGATIVEGTAGNTGIGLAVVGNALGYCTAIVMPNNQSQEKVDTLRALGAEVTLIPAVPYKNPEHFVHTSRRLAESLNARKPGSALWADQFDNLANRAFHAETTGPEIWAQTNGKIDGFTCAAGTGGTLGGVSRYLKAKNPNVRIGLADPTGSGLYSYFTTGEFTSEGGSVSEGIGNSRLTANLDGSPIDAFYRIPDSESVPLVFDLNRHEGLCLGGSSGVNVAGAMRVGGALGRGHSGVTVLCVSGFRYPKRLYNPAWLRE